MACVVDNLNDDVVPNRRKNGKNFVVLWPEDAIFKAASMQVSKASVVRDNCDFEDGMFQLGRYFGT